MLSPRLIPTAGLWQFISTVKSLITNNATINTRRHLKKGIMSKILILFFGLLMLVFVSIGCSTVQAANRHRLTL